MPSASALSVLLRYRVKKEAGKPVITFKLPARLDGIPDWVDIHPTPQARVYAAFAEKECRLISERTRAELSSLKENGTSSATRPTQPRRSQGRFAATVLPIRRSCVTSLRGIANALDNRGARTARGRHMALCGGRRQKWFYSRNACLKH
ncbi:hypothetical protein [Mesorhizobium escarrei]